MKKTIKSMRSACRATIPTLFFCGILTAGVLTNAVSVMAQSGASNFSIAAVVNDRAVSVADVNNRAKLVIESSGMTDNQEIRQRMKPQIMSALIDEALILEEADRLEIEVSDEEVEKAFASLAAQNKLSAAQFRQALSQSGVIVSTIYDQIRAQVTWSHIIQKKVRPQIDISDDEVDSALERLKSRVGTTSYLVSEIFLPVAQPADEPDVRALADKLVRQIVQSGAPFQTIAGQFSQSAGASRGGDLGWVQEGDLPEAVDDTLSGMKKGEISNPVRSLTGFHILYLRDQKTFTEADLPSRDGLFYTLSLEELDRLQRRYLLDLKAAAFIEQRV